MLQDWHIMLIVLGVIIAVMAIAGVVIYGLRSIPYSIGTAAGVVIGALIGWTLGATTFGAGAGFVVAVIVGLIVNFVINDNRQQKERNARLYPKKYQ